MGNSRCFSFVNKLLANLVHLVLNMASAVAKLGNIAKVGIDAGVPKLQTFFKYAKVELVPPTPMEVAKAVGEAGVLVKKGLSFHFMKLSVKENFVACMVGAEVGLWFFLGEIIGKGKIIGYQV